MKQKLTLDIDTLRVESFRSSETVEARGTVVAHGPSAQCPTYHCTELYGGYTCLYTCAYSCDGTCWPCLA
jgi:hypothetical protein